MHGLFLVYRSRAELAGFFDCRFTIQAATNRSPEAINDSSEGSGTAALL